MISYRGVKIYPQNQQLVTDGLCKAISFELRVATKSCSEEEYCRLLNYLIDYVLDDQPQLVSGQTISYHSWLLKLQKISEFECELWEANRNGDDFKIGVEYALQVVRDQEEECKKHDVIPQFPTFSQNIVISKGVYEGLGVEAVRYPSPEHMTGWWITTDMYNDEVDTLTNVHYFHLAFQRPDILRYLALPFGYRFYMSKEEKDVWYDENT